MATDNTDNKVNKLVTVFANRTSEVTCCLFIVPGYAHRSDQNSVYLDYFRARSQPYSATLRQCPQINFCTVIKFRLRSALYRDTRSPQKILYLDRKNTRQNLLAPGQISSLPGQISGGAVVGLRLLTLLPGR